MGTGYEYLEVNFHQKLNKHLQGISGEVYGVIYNSGKAFESGELVWEEVWAAFEKTMTVLGETGWDLVSVTKLPLPSTTGFEIIKSLYFKRILA
mgnify:CR=1 FL=1